VHDPQAGWRERARGGASPWADYGEGDGDGLDLARADEPRAARLPRTLWSDAPGRITVANDGYAPRGETQVLAAARANGARKYGIGATRVGRLFFWIVTWIRYFRRVRARRAARIRGRPWSPPRVDPRGIVGVMATDFQGSGARNVPLRVKLARAADRWTAAQDGDGTEAGAWGAMILSPAPPAMMRAAEANIRTGAAHAGDPGAPGTRIGIYARPEFYGGVQGSSAGSLVRRSPAAHPQEDPQIPLQQRTSLSVGCGDFFF
jgi:hypothetical protein